MYKMKMELDYDKMQENGYNVENIKNFLATELDKRNITKNEEGFYVGGSFEAFWGFILSMSDTDWFLSIVKDWLWYNPDYSSVSDDYSVEDLVEFYNSDRYREIVNIGK